LKNPFTIGKNILKNTGTIASHTLSNPLVDASLLVNLDQNIENATDAFNKGDYKTAAMEAGLAGLSALPAYRFLKGAKGVPNPSYDDFNPTVQPTQNILDSKGLLGYKEGGASGCPPGYTKVNGKCKKVKPFVTSDPEEYAFRRAAYDDSLWMYEHNQRQPNLRQPAHFRNSSNWFRNLANWSANETISNRRNFTLSPNQFHNGAVRNHDVDQIRRLGNNLGLTALGNTLFNENRPTNNTFNTREAYNLTAAAEDMRNIYSPYRRRNPLIPWNNPISYVGRSARYTDNIGQGSNYISQIETRYKPPVQPVIYKPKPNTDNKVITKPKPPITKEAIPPTPITEQVIPIPTPIPPGPPPVPPIPPGPPPGPGTDVMPAYDIDETPMYATPDPDAQWVNQKERYIDWDANTIPYRLPRFRKPGHGGDLIKPGKRRYISLPGIETRNSAYIQREEEYKDGGVVMKLSKKEIEQYIKEGYIIEDE